MHIFAVARASTRRPTAARRSAKAKAAEKARNSLPRRLLRWTLAGAAGLVALVLLLVLLFALIDPRLTPYMLAERHRLGHVDRDWVDLDAVAPVMQRSVVAAEDANFCLHWGFDMTAIRDALEAGAGRGASTLSQQVVKNVYLWQGRSWLRKAIEAMMTPLLEAIWTKRRILEVYLNVAEFGEGVFGIEAAAQKAFGRSARDLSADQAARLAAVLPSPKSRDAARPTASMARRARGIADGAATIAADGRAECFAG